MSHGLLLLNSDTEGVADDPGCLPGSCCVGYSARCIDALTTVAGAVQGLLHISYLAHSVRLSFLKPSCPRCAPLGALHFRLGHFGSSLFHRWATPESLAGI